MAEGRRKKTESSREEECGRYSRRRGIATTPPDPQAEYTLPSRRRLVFVAEAGAKRRGEDLQPDTNRLYG
jgi:hypothetical protein